MLEIRKFGFGAMVMIKKNVFQDVLNSAINGAIGGSKSYQTT